MPLLTGISVYLLFRPPLSWFPYILGWDSVIINLSPLPIFLSDFIKFHLTDILWALSFVEVIYLITKNKYIAITIVIVSTIIFEVGQYFGIISGTGDIRDVICVLIMLVIYAIIISIMEGNKNE